jgi:hypothetical protein
MFVQPPLPPAAANRIGRRFPDDNDGVYPMDLLSPNPTSTNSKSTFVTPSLPLTPDWMKLPALDQIESRVIIPVVLVFQLSSPACREPLLRDLKISLANTIEELPYIAAHVVPDCDEQGTIQLEISDDAGVWFHSQEMPELEYDALERRRFPCSAFPFSSSMIPEPRLHHPQRSPVLTMLATFITGGLVLAFNIHHSVSDGSGVRPLIKVFAKHLAALSEGRFVSAADIFPDETLDRSIIFGGSGRKHICDIPNYRVSETYRFSRERELLEASLAGDEKHAVLQQLQLSQWAISDEALLSVREAASHLHGNESSPVLTDHAILCAVLWRHVSRARLLSSSGTATSSFVSVVNVRRRMDPPLSSEYTGNAVVHAKTSAAVSDVESAEPGTLYELAQEIAHAIEWWTSERIWELIGAINSCEMVSKIEPDLDSFQGPDLEVSNIAEMGDLFELDWGRRLGTMKACRCAYVPFKDGWILILPRKKGTDLELLLALEKDVINRLKQDKEWLALAMEAL